MDNDCKEIIHAEINEPLNKIVGIFTPEIKKHDYKLMTLWIIVGVLALMLIYYANEMIYIYF